MKTKIKGFNVVVEPVKDKVKVYVGNWLASRTFFLGREDAVALGQCLLAGDGCVQVGADRVGFSHQNENTVMSLGKRAVVITPQQVQTLHEMLVAALAGLTPVS